MSDEAQKTVPKECSSPAESVAQGIQGSSTVAAGTRISDGDDEK